MDSLLNELQGAKEDTNAVNILNELSAGYSNISVDEALKFGRRAIDLAENLKWERGIADANARMGVNCMHKSDYPKALDCFTKALKIYEEAGNSDGIASVLSNIGIFYKEQSDYPRALEYYFRALKIHEQTGNKKGMAKTLGNIGSVYHYQLNYPKALEFGFKALAIDREIGNRQHEGSVTANIGGTYSAQKDYAKALEFYFKALKLSEETGNKIDEALITGNIGNTYTKQGNNIMAIAYGRKALAMNEALGRNHSIAWRLSQLGNAYLALATDTVSSVKTPAADMAQYLPPGTIPMGKSARLQVAISYLHRAIDTARRINALDVMKDAYEALSQAYASGGDYRKALENYRLLAVMKDSVFSQENEKKTLRTAMQYDFDKQRFADSLKTVEKEKIALLKLEKQRTYTYIGIAIALLLSAFLMYVLKRDKMLDIANKRNEELLLNILPAEVADELKNKGSAAARHYDNVTVVFTDFVNFTNAGEKMNPQALIDELHTCFKAFDEITARYNIEKIKTIGDAYLAVSGLPMPDEKHAEHVVSAAKEMCAFMAERHRRLGDKTFELRVGIHSGNVVAGIVGVKKFAYDIWGDTVNTAARMEQNSRAGRINISSTTYELVKDKFACEYRGEIEAKNKGQLKMYFVN